MSIKLKHKFALVDPYSIEGFPGSETEQYISCDIIRDLLLTDICKAPLDGKIDNFITVRLTCLLNGGLIKWQSLMTSGAVKYYQDEVRWFSSYGDAENPHDRLDFLLQKDRTYPSYNLKVKRGVMGYELKINYPKIDALDLKGLPTNWNRDAILYKDAVQQSYPNMRTCFKNIEGKHPTWNDIKYLVTPSKEIYHYVPDIRSTI